MSVFFVKIGFLLNYFSITSCLSSLNILGKFISLVQKNSDLAQIASHISILNVTVIANICVTPSCYRP